MRFFHTVDGNMKEFSENVARSMNYDFLYLMSVAYNKQIQTKTKFLCFMDKGDTVPAF